MRAARERTEDFPVATMLRVGGRNEKDNQTKGNKHVRHSANVGS
jgi:hypothetical protein